MASWQEFADADPELAAYGAGRLAQRVAYLATVRPDGGPRVHPVTPFIGQGRLIVYMEPTSPKGRDLRRDARYALHCGVEDTGGGRGEFLLLGQARLVEEDALRAQLFDVARSAGMTPKERFVIFEFHVGSVLATTYQAGDPVRRRWQATGASR